MLDAQAISLLIDTMYRLHLIDVKKFYAIQRLIWGIYG